MIYTVNNTVVTDPAPSKVPPAPVLLCRTDTMMIFKPAPFKSEDGQQVDQPPQYIIIYITCC